MSSSLVSRYVSKFCNRYVLDVSSYFFFNSGYVKVKHLNLKDKFDSNAQKRIP